jgi:hypothetical protein
VDIFQIFAILDDTGGREAMPATDRVRLRDGRIISCDQFCISCYSCENFEVEEKVCGLTGKHPKSIKNGCNGHDSMVFGLALSRVRAREI